MVAMSKSAIHFRLYIAGEGPNSLLAISNLNRLCATIAPQPESIEIVDVFMHPDQALQENVLITPTLVLSVGGETRRIVGNLSQPDVVLRALEASKG